MITLCNRGITQNPIPNFHRTTHLVMDVTTGRQAHVRGESRRTCGDVWFLLLWACLLLRPCSCGKWIPRGCRNAWGLATLRKIAGS